MGGGAGGRGCGRGGDGVGCRARGCVGWCWRRNADAVVQLWSDQSAALRLDLPVTGVVALETRREKFQRNIKRAAREDFWQQGWGVAAHQAAADEHKFVVLPIACAVILHAPGFCETLPGYQGGSVWNVQVLQQRRRHGARGWGGCADWGYLRSGADHGWSRRDFLPAHGFNHHRNFAGRDRVFAPLIKFYLYHGRTFCGGDPGLYYQAKSTRIGFGGIKAD